MSSTFSPDALPPLLTTAQAAEVLGVTVRMAGQLCDRGEIKAVRVGRLWRINRDALLAYAGLS